jgi:hypothetical protein
MEIIARCFSFAKLMLLVVAVTEFRPKFSSSNFYCLGIVTRSHLRIICGLLPFMKILRDVVRLVVRVPGYRSRGSWFDSRRYQIL